MVRAPIETTTASLCERFAMSGIHRTLLCFLTIAALPVASYAAAPSAAEALTLKPVQSDAQFDQPNAAQVKQCSIKSEKLGGRSGWVVRGPAGQLFRCFADTNGDSKVDQWCYYLNGLSLIHI